MNLPNWMLSAAVAALVCCSAQTVERPAIVGVAHIALKAKDLSATREFYGRYLGYGEVPAGPHAARFEVNAHQYVDVSDDLTSATEDRLSHIAFETLDAKQLRDYLASRGVSVPQALDSRANEVSFTMKDPEGHEVRFVQYIGKPGRPPAATHISERIIHVGVTVADRAAADHLYKDILGFRETWHGGMRDDRTDWVDMRVPDGTDWLEYMMNVRNPTPKTLGVMHHLALGVPSVEAAYKTLLDRGMKIDQPPKIGRDGKWQLNLYDPDLTRAELMEPKPVQTPCCSPMLEK